MPTLKLKHKTWKPSESSYSYTVINKKSQKKCKMLTLDQIITAKDHHYSTIRKKTSV